jgi:hypothetical protein
LFGDKCRNPNIMRGHTEGGPNLEGKG